MSVLPKSRPQVAQESVPAEEPAAQLDVGPSAVWVTWERQRRTTEIARRLGVALERFLYRGPTLVRYARLSHHTWNFLRRVRPRVLIIQNPSIVLAVVGALARRFLGLRLVVDRHTNFGLNQPPSLKKSLFTLVSRFTLRNADLTIVTNRPLARIVEEAGGRAFVLPDAIPALEPGGTIELGGRRNVCFICTYAGDEPYAEFLKISGQLPEDVHVYVTGDPSRGAWTPELESVRDSNERLTLTGFVDEPSYVALLEGCDVIVDLTTFDHCLVCGAYEAIAAGRTLVLSDKQANRDLFGELPVYVSADGESMLRGLQQALEEAPERATRVREFRPEYQARWEDSLRQLAERIREF